MAGLLERVLLETLHRWAREPGDMAAGICATSVLDYVEQLSGQTADPDPRAMSARARAAAVRSEAAFEALCRDVMQRLGWAKISVPQRGDVGLVARPEGLTACICFDRFGKGPRAGSWAARGARCAIIQPAEAILAWAVPAAIREAR